MYRLINIITSVTRKNNNIDTESFKYYFRANKKIITKLRLHKRILQDISQQYVPIPEHTTWSIRPLQCTLSSTRVWPPESTCIQLQETTTRWTIRQQLCVLKKSNINEITLSRHLNAQWQMTKINLRQKVNIIIQW